MMPAQVEKIMIRGFMKTTSRTALLAAAGLLIGSYAYGPAAKAADLGGSCCGDLEERVAELEATTARKGNRKVSLQIYGLVNRGLLIWDDGTDSDAYVVDNDAQSTRFGFTGKASMKPGWTAGFNIELEVQDAASDEVDQNNDDIGASATASSVSAEIVRTRLANWYIESDRLGRVTVGQASTASDGITEIALHNQAGKTVGSTAFVRTFGVLGAPTSAANARWGDIASNLAGLGRNDIVRYDTPTLHGFILSTSWGDDDLWDAALRFKKEWNSIRLAAGIAYFYDGTGGFSTDSEMIGGSISVMHVPTGIFGHFSAGEKDYKSEARDDAQYWGVQFGVERKWLPYGLTTIYGEYASFDGDFDNRSGFVAFDPDTNPNPGVNAFDGAEASKWGFSLIQNFESAALDLYLQAEFWDASGISTVDDGELTVVMIGSRIKF
jgi:Gram-negative porin